MAIKKAKIGQRVRLIADWAHERPQDYEPTPVKGMVGTVIDTFNNLRTYCYVEFDEMSSEDGRGWTVGFHELARYTEAAHAPAAPATPTRETPMQAMVRGQAWLDGDDDAQPAAPRTIDDLPTQPSQGTTGMVYEDAEEAYEAGLMYDYDHDVNKYEPVDSHAFDLTIAEAEIAAYAPQPAAPAETTTGDLSIPVAKLDALGNVVAIVESVDRPQSAAPEQGADAKANGLDDWKDRALRNEQYAFELQRERDELRAALFNLLDMCDVQARNDGVLSVLRDAMEQARELLAATDKEQQDGR